MARLYLLEGDPEAPGWSPLQADAKAKKINVIIFDRDRWALVEADDPPTGYEGMQPTDPVDGMYVDNQGRPVFVVGCNEVPTAQDVVDAMTPERREQAERLRQQIGDLEFVLERMGKAY